MIPTLSQIQSAKDRLAFPGFQPWDGAWFQSWAEFDQRQTSFATILFGMAPHLFKLYREVGQDVIAFEVDKSGVSISTESPSATHELAHWVEMRDQRRWLLPNWNIPSKSLSTRGRHGKMGLPAFKITVPGTIAALSREVRVLAIEARMRLYIPNRDLEPGKMREGVSRWGEEFFLGDLIELPFGKFKERKDIRLWVSEVWQSTFDAWNLDRVEEEFKIRLNTVREFVETKE